MCSVAPWRPTLLTRAENRLSERPLVPGRKFPTGIFFLRVLPLKKLINKIKYIKLTQLFCSPHAPKKTEGKQRSSFIQGDKMYVGPKN